MSGVCYQHGLLPVSDGHRVYYELSGNPDGEPVLVIHGGPGAGLSSRYTDFFDLSVYHVIGFEQRGCGRSQPHLSLSHNTTQDLLTDITRLREHLGISRWLMFGGSWGTTLALLAAMREPETVSGLILRGIFLARDEDFEWFLAPDGGAAQIYPDAYQRFIEYIDKPTNFTAVLAHYSEGFAGKDERRRHQAAIRWYQWEEAIARVHSPGVQVQPDSAPPLMLSLAVLEWHYITNRCFISENEILQQAHRLAGIPGRIIHGRCDTVCKPQGAYALHQRWPDSNLLLIDGAGHSSAEPAIAMALREATHQFILKR
ncbi:MAG: prolyl aminopeptidase [Gammaproteobacteria bacterium]|nr:prolyl aminopeptidase [Gammaproteobacteria bacterium]